MTHAEFEYELVEALNMLLEDERASVEMEVALASGATEYAEREALSFMGVEDIHFCEELRVEMEHAGLPVTPQINGVVFQVIGAERYDDRLRAFAHHQRTVAEHARELQESNLDGALRDALEGIAETHERHTQWTEQRANEFAATRLLEFGAAARGAALAPDDAPPADDPAPEDHASMDGRMDHDTPTVRSRAWADQPTEEPTAGRAEQPAEWAAEAKPAALELGAIVEVESAEPLEPEEVAAETATATEVTEPKPRARATRGATRAASAAKVTKATKTTTKTAKATAKPAAKPRVVAKPKAATPVPRRTRRTPTQGDGASEA